MAFTSSQLDAWITGNYGEDQFDDRGSAPMRCRCCNADFIGDPSDIAICDACAKRGAVQCAECGDYHFPADMVGDTDDDPFCRWCVDDAIRGLGNAIYRFPNMNPANARLEGLI